MFIHIKRQILGTAFGAAVILTGGPALAEAPQIKTQVAGWYRIMVGSYEVTALSDGYLNFDNKLIQHAAPGEIAKGMERSFVEKGESIPTAINAFLINTGKKLILVDVGTAKLFGPSLGFVTENLRASGYDPAQVDLVLLTHLHGDHANGLLTPEGKIAFPNATVMATEAEATFWLDKEKAAHPPKELAAFFQMANADVAPYSAKGGFKTFKPNTEVSAGITAVPMAIGHTPGHTGFKVESGGERLIITGDVVHVGAVQFADPGVSVVYDLDDKSAIASRKTFFAQAAKDKTLLACAHVGFPGLGHLRAEGRGFVWIPVQYAPVK
jgi:glyoxylase-like metal-dependent hydrolase (beta-lactamase superfamily II)